jgi:peroxiredoxin
MKRFAMLVLAVVVTGSIQAAPFKKGLVGQQFPQFSEADLVTGEKISLNDVLAKDGAKGAVVFFTSYVCPVAKAYEGRINDLADKYKGSISFIGVNSNQSEKAEEQIKYAKDNGFKFHITSDKDSKTAKEIGGSVTPEFYLLDKTGKILYHGPVDDSQDPQVIEHKYLINAIEAHLAGKTLPAEESEIQAFGCGIKFPK